MGGVQIKRLLFTNRAKTAALAVAVFALLPFSASAVESESRPNNAITVSPTSQQISLEAGSTVTETFKVINTGQTVFEYSVYGSTYSVEGLEYDPNYSDETVRGGAYKWLTFEKSEGLLNPGEEDEITYTLNPPADAPLGGNYGVIFVETQPQGDAENQEILRKKRVGMVLRTNIEGDSKFEGDVIRTSLPWIQFSTPLTATFDVQNTGNVDFDVGSTITIRDLFGNEKFRSDKNNVVYPDTTRRIVYEWNDANWFGIYKVDLAGTYINQDFSQSRYVFVTPQWLLMVVGIAAVFGVYALFQRRR